MDLTIPDQLANDTRAIRNQVAHGTLADNPLGPWILQFSDAVFNVCGAGNIPRGPGLLSVLKDSAYRVRDTIPTIRGHLPNETKARSLAQSVADRLDAACSALLGDVKILLTTEADGMSAGEMIEIALYVENQGPLPLRHFRIETSPDWGRRKIEYLAENHKDMIHLSGVGPKTIGTFTLRVNWSASTLDGQEKEGKREIPLKVVEPGIETIDGQVELGACSQHHKR